MWWVRRFSSHDGRFDKRKGIHRPCIAVRYQIQYIEQRAFNTTAGEPGMALDERKRRWSYILPEKRTTKIHQSRVFPLVVPSPLLLQRILLTYVLPPRSLLHPLFHRHRIRNRVCRSCCFNAWLSVLTSPWYPLLNQRYRITIGKVHLPYTIALHYSVSNYNLLSSSFTENDTTLNIFYSSGNFKSPSFSI